MRWELIGQLNEWGGKSDSQIVRQSDSPEVG